MDSLTRYCRLRSCHSDARVAMSGSIDSGGSDAPAGQMGGRGASATKGTADRVGIRSELTNGLSQPTGQSYLTGACSTKASQCREFQRNFQRFRKFPEFDPREVYYSSLSSDLPFWTVRNALLRTYPRAEPDLRGGRCEDKGGKRDSHKRETELPLPG